LTLTACGASAASPSTQSNESPQVESALAALENPLIKCQQDHASCIGGAKDTTSRMTCDGTFQSCLDDAAKQGQEAAKQLQDCRDQARECVTKAGANAAMSCRTDYETCVRGVTGAGTAGAGAAGSGPSRPQLPQLPAAGRRAPRLPIGGGLAFPPNPGGPRLPAAGGGAPHLPRAPFAGAPALPGGFAGRGGEPPRRPVPPAEQCFAELRACVRMPGSNFEQCAMTARACLRSGGEPGAAGSGETGGTGGM
jgi:hypothetical protein